MRVTSTSCARRLLTQTLAVAIVSMAGATQAISASYLLDVDDTSNVQTQSGWDSLLRSSPTTLDGISFELFSSATLNDRIRSSVAGQIARDFIFADAPGAVVGVRLGSPTATGGTATVPAGLWKVEVWSFENNTDNAGDALVVGPQILGYETLVEDAGSPGTYVNLPNTVVATDVIGTNLNPGVPPGPAGTFMLEADGSSYYSIYLEDDPTNEFNRTRLNGVRLTMVPEPGALGLAVVLAVGVVVRRRHT